MNPFASRFILFAMLTAPAVAEDFDWRDGSGQIESASEARKSANGFGAWLLTTSDADWMAKWNTPQEVVPQFTVADSVGKGEKIVTLLLLVNPSRDSSGKVDVRCDIQVTRPDGTISISQRDLPCMKGEMKGPAFNIRMSPMTLPFVGEASDPKGTWIIEAKVRDVRRKTTLSLRTSFEYLGDEQPATEQASR